METHSLVGYDEDDQPAPPWIVVCDWGCLNGSAIDCSTDAGEMIFLHDSGREIRGGISFRQWMEDWATGIDLWVRVRGTE